MGSTHAAPPWQSTIVRSSSRVGTRQLLNPANASAFTWPIHDVVFARQKRPVLFPVTTHHVYLWCASWRSRIFASSPATVFFSHMRFVRVSSTTSPRSKKRPFADLLGDPPRICVVGPPPRHCACGLADIQT